MEEIITITLTDIERRILVRALDQLRTDQIANKKHHDSIDEILMRVCDAKVQKTRNKSYEER